MSLELDRLPVWTNKVLESTSTSWLSACMQCKHHFNTLNSYSFELWKTPMLLKRQFVYPYLSSKAEEFQFQSSPVLYLKHCCMLPWGPTLKVPRNLALRIVHHLHNVFFLSTLRNYSFRNPADVLVPLDHGRHREIHANLITSFLWQFGPVIWSA